MNQVLVDYVLENLYNTVPMTVVFKKADGTERRMTCTANFLLIPTDKHPQSPKAPDPNDEVIRAFDLEKNEWRSFRKDSIIRIEKINSFKWHLDEEIEFKAVVEPSPKIVDISEL